MTAWVLPGAIWLVLVFASGVLTFIPQRRQVPKPDYRRIAWLERELGMVPSADEPAVGEFEARLRGRARR